MQRREEKFCPLCRAEVVMQASEGKYCQFCFTYLYYANMALDNIDRRLEKYLSKYFDREVKDKERANQIEKGIEDFGSSYKHTDCLVM